MEDEAQKILKEVSGELFVCDAFVKSKEFKKIEKDYVAIAEGLKQSHEKLTGVKKEAMECITEGAALKTTIKMAKEAVNASSVQRQFAFKLAHGQTV